MRRARHAAILLAIATGLGWSGPAADARASRPQVADATPSSIEVPVMPETERSNAVIVDSEWRYVPARR